MVKDELATAILHNAPISSENSGFIHEFLNKMESDRRLREVSVNYFRGCLGHFNIDTIKLLANIYYYPNEVKIDKYPQAIKLLALYLSSKQDDFNNDRLDMISDFVNEGSSFVDKVMRTLFMFDLHLILRDNVEFAFYMNLLDYNDLRDFLELNDIDYYTKQSNGKLDNESFVYQLNFVKNKIQNQSMRIIR